MSRARTVHVCTECGTSHPKWAGQCAGCGEWNTLVEEMVSSGLATEDHGPRATRPTSGDARPPQRLDDVAATEGATQPTGIPELDQVLSGGFVPGSVTLMGGEPGIGKSTLLLQVARTWQGSVLYVCAEESAQQVRHRAERLGAIRPDVWLLAETGRGDSAAAVDEIDPSLIIVDSIQTVLDPSVGSTPGSVTQVRACAQFLTSIAKRREIPVVMVGHVTKDGDLAGPRVLEHLVDTVLSFEGDRHHSLRLVRAVKHRFGSTNELSVFEMGDSGLRPVSDPSELFLSDRRAGVAGSAVVPTLEGRRPVVIEIQALTHASAGGIAARRTTGVDTSRLAMILAVLARHAGLQSAQHDVYSSVVGGVRVSEPGLDLGIALALASSLLNRPLAADAAVFGEVGLGGEIRQVSHPERRLAEAARLGFTHVVAPARTPEGPAGLQVIRVGDIREALLVTGLSAAH
ncbi:MAG: DNA repair protein RadA [Ilumatobacteraceae bacterium]